MYAFFNLHDTVEFVVAVVDNRAYQINSIERLMIYVYPLSHIFVNIYFTLIESSRNFLFPAFRNQVYGNGHN